MAWENVKAITVHGYEGTLWLNRERGYYAATLDNASMSVEPQGGLYGTQLKNAAIKDLAEQVEARIAMGQLRRKGKPGISYTPVRGSR